MCKQLQQVEVDSVICAWTFHSRKESYLGKHESFHHMLYCWCITSHNSHDSGAKNNHIFLYFHSMYSFDLIKETLSFGILLHNPYTTLIILGFESESTKIIFLWEKLIVIWRFDLFLKYEKWVRYSFLYQFHSD